MTGTVLVLVDDLFWQTKIEHSVSAAQIPVKFRSDPAELAETADPAKVALVIVDLALKKEPFSAIAALKRKSKGIPVIGYYEHVRRDVMQKGTDAGCDEVVARSYFSQHLGDLVMKYAIPGGVRTESEEHELPEE